MINRLKYIFSIIACLISFDLPAQQQRRTIEGVVTDEENIPLPGATIVQVGTDNGTIADEKGYFKINVDEGSVVKFMYMGYDDLEVSVKGRENFNIVMKQSADNLEDVVVVGYQTMRKESLTGAVSNITSKDIVTSKSPSLALNLAGKVAGFNIRQQNGQPGLFSTSINIRGMGSPLFIIDGIVRDGATEFQRLNPDDIESISFLKDGTAAIYGMNSSNGAVIVTTKKGRRQKNKIDYSVNLGFSSPTDMPKMCNAAQWYELMVDSQVNVGNAPYVTETELEAWRKGGESHESFDYYDELFKNSAMRQQHNLSMSGGNDRYTFFTSIGYTYDGGLLRLGEISYSQYSVRSNVHANIAKNLSADVNIYGSYAKRRQGTLNYPSLFFVSIVEPPISPIYANNNKLYYNNFTYGINPVAGSDEDISGYDRVKTRTFQSTLSLSYNFPFLKDLQLKAQISYDYNDYSTKILSKAFYLYSYDAGTDVYTPHLTNSPSSINSNKSSNDRVDTQLSVSYKNTFAQKHDLSVLYVFETRRQTYEGLDGFRYYDLYTIDDLNYGRTSDMRNAGSSSEANYLSHIGRFNYAYDGKYLLELACRYDGSYRYSDDNRWAFFPMGSIGWIASKESFIRDNISILSNLKFRMSYGSSGEDAGTPFQYLEGYTLNSGGTLFSKDKFTSGIINSGLTNSHLTWYKSKIYDIGVDFSLWNGMLGGEFDVFRRNRSGLLATRDISLPNTFGATLPQENLNKDRTEGFELTLTHSNHVGEFMYTIKGNISLSRTKTIYAEEGYFNSSWNKWRSQSTGRYQNFRWGYKTDGRFESEEDLATLPIQDGIVGNSKELPGDYIIKDVNGDGHIDSNDMLPIFWGSSPMTYYGLNISANWRNFDFNVLFQGAGCYTVRYMDCYGVMLYQQGNTPEYFMDRWHYSDPYDISKGWVKGKWPAIRPDGNTGTLYFDTSVWRRNATYLRLKSIEFGYTINPKFLRKINISYCRFYVNGNNLLTFCDSFVKAFDPEKTEGQSNAGITYPLTKCISFGANITF